MPVEDFTYIDSVSTHFQSRSYVFCWISFLRAALVSYLYICTIVFAFAVRDIFAYTRVLEFGFNISHERKYRDDIHVS